MTITTLNPEKWLVTTIRGIKDYTEDQINNAVENDINASVGLQAYEVVMEFPSTDNILKMLPLAKTIIHFEIDAIDNNLLGFGRNIGKEIYDPYGESIVQQEVTEHRINFDVGIWTSDRAGGITKRLEAYEILNLAFKGAKAFDRLFEATTSYDLAAEFDGAIEILEFLGGRFLTESISDINVYRMIGANLTVRVYGRTPIDDPFATIESIIQDPDIELPS